MQAILKQRHVYNIYFLKYYIYIYIISTACRYTENKLCYLKRACVFVCLHVVFNIFMILSLIKTHVLTSGQFIDLYDGNDWLVFGKDVCVCIHAA